MARNFVSMILSAGINLCKVDLILSADDLTIEGTTITTAGPDPDKPEDRAPLMNASLAIFLP